MCTNNQFSYLHKSNPSIRNFSSTAARGITRQLSHIFSECLRANFCMVKPTSSLGKRTECKGKDPFNAVNNNPGSDVASLRILTVALARDAIFGRSLLDAA